MATLSVANDKAISPAVTPATANAATPIGPPNAAVTAPNLLILPFSAPTTACVPVNDDVIPAPNILAAVAAAFQLFTISLISIVLLNVTTAPAVLAKTVPNNLAWSTRNAKPSISLGNAPIASSATFDTIVPIPLATLAMLSESLPFFKLALIESTLLIAVSAASFKGCWNSSYISIPKPSKALPNIVSLPFKLSFMVLAISSAAPAESLMYPLNSSNRSPLLASKALTDFKSTLLNMVFNTLILSSSDISPNLPFKS